MKNLERLIPAVAAAALSTAPYLPATGNATDIAPRPQPLVRETLRRPVAAYRFYEGAPHALQRQVRDCLAKAKENVCEGRLVAGVVPHAGLVYSGRCAASLYALIKPTAYKRIIILGPSHAYPLRGIWVPPASMAACRTPLGDVPVDQPACAKLRASPGFTAVDDADSEEHSIEVQLPFLQITAEHFSLVPLMCGEIGGPQIDSFAAAIAQCFDEDTLLLASSDFTHYGPRYRYVPFRDDVKNRLRHWLAESAGLIANLNEEGFKRHLAETSDTICGRIPIQVLMAVLRTKGLKTKGAVLDSYTSGDISGDYGNSVSYTAIGYFVETRAGP